MAFTNSYSNFSTKGKIMETYRETTPALDGDYSKGNSVSKEKKYIYKYIYVSTF